MEEPRAAHGLREHKVRKLRIVKLFVFAALALTIFGLLVMSLWNWLMPTIFGLRLISYWQAVGLLILSRILFGSFIGRHGGGRWPRGMFERWAEMTPEEREKFRAGMWRDFGPFEPPTPESKS